MIFNAVSFLYAIIFIFVNKTGFTLPTGEEICISYLDDCLLSRSRHSRQKELQQNYLFNCTCQKCEEQKGDADVTSDEEDEDDDKNESMDED